jgi:hypothetical protein
MMSQYEFSAGASAVPSMTRAFCCAVALSTLWFVGCDLTGQYDKRFHDSLQKAAQRAVFDLNLHATPSEIVDAARQNVGVKIRLPKLFDGSSKSLPPADPKAQPPAVKLPGLAYAVERPLDDDSGQFLPTYVYFAAVPKTEQKADALQAALAQQVAAIAPGATWADVQLPTPTGQTVAFKRLRAEGKQEFTSAQKKAPASVDSRLDLFLVDAGERNVLIGWRAPKAQAQKYQLEAAIDAAMGTVEVTAPPGQPGKAPAAAPAAAANPPS